MLAFIVTFFHEGSLHFCESIFFVTALNQLKITFNLLIFHLFITLLSAAMLCVVLRGVILFVWDSEAFCSANITVSAQSFTLELNSENCVKVSEYMCKLSFLKVHYATSLCACKQTKRQSY